MQLLLEMAVVARDDNCHDKYCLSNPNLPPQNLQPKLSVSCTYHYMCTIRTNLINVTTYIYIYIYLSLTLESSISVYNLPCSTGRNCMKITTNLHDCGVHMAMNFSMLIQLHACKYSSVRKKDIPSSVSIRRCMMAVMNQVALILISLYMLSPISEPSKCIILLQLQSESYIPYQNSNSLQLPKTQKNLLALL